MKPETLVRIIDVTQHTNGTYSVSFFDGDLENVVTWRTAPPKIGDILAIDPANPDLKPRLINRAEPAGWNPQGDALRWRKPLKGQSFSRMEILRRRHRIKQTTCSWFDEEGFIEIESPLLVRGTTPDVSVQSFELEDRYLVTSTEYQLKRLAIGGFDKLYSLTKNFRAGDVSSVRNPEFTMLEWGRVGSPLEAIEKDAENIILNAMLALGLERKLTFNGRSVDMTPPWPHTTVAQAIARVTGHPFHAFDTDNYLAALEAARIEVRSEWMEHDDFLFSLLMDHIQPQLGHHRPEFLIDWPLHQTSSAAENTTSQRALRSELFIQGIELADGFSGVASASIQASFFEQMVRRRHLENLKPIQLDSFYLEALRQGAPVGAGMALGFDRLVMLLTGQTEIQNVLAFAWHEV